MTPILAELFATETSWAGGAAGDAARIFTESTTYATWQRFQLAANGHDARNDATSITAPTRVVFPRAQRLLALDRPRALAGAIPGAELVIVDGFSVLPYAGDASIALETIIPFLDDGD